MEYLNSKVAQKLLEIINIDIDFNTIKESIESHPYSFKLISIIDTFNDLGIDNIALKLPNSDFEKIKELPLPLIVHISDSEEDSALVVVKNLSNNIVEYYSAAYGNMSETWETFKAKWSGITLLAFKENYIPTKNEASNNKAKLNTIFTTLVYSMLLLSLCGLAWVISIESNSLAIMFLLSLKIIGLTISILLLKHQHEKGNSFVDKICSSGNSASDCNKVLDNNESKLLGIFDWSELGFIYFFGGFLLILFGSYYDFYNVSKILGFLNIFTLIFSMYSVWFQYYKVKSWCYFCLFTLLIFWSEFFCLNYIISYHSLFFSLNFITLCVYLLSFSIAVLSVSYVVTNLKKNTQLTDKNIELNRVKFNKSIIDFSWQNSKKLDTISSIGLKLLDHENATQNLTIVTNPTCNPCAKTHKKLESYLKGTYNNLDINIIFSTPMHNTDSNRYKVTRKMIQIHKQKGTKIALQALDEWFNDNEKDFEKWNKKFVVEDIDVSDTMTEHYNWCVSSDISYTPTIVLNGVEIPAIYTVSDVKHFID